jgi:hypothetical protein
LTGVLQARQDCVSLATAQKTILPQTIIEQATRLEAATETRSPTQRFPADTKYASLRIISHGSPLNSIGSTRYILELNQDVRPFRRVQGPPALLESGSQTLAADTVEQERIGKIIEISRVAIH